MTQTYKIALIPGDGIGPEVISEAKRVLERVAELDDRIAFKPIHGSAPDIAGQGIANPLASIWAASQLLDFLGCEEWGKKIVDAIEDMLGERRIPDAGSWRKRIDFGLRQSIGRKAEVNLFYL